MASGTRQPLPAARAGSVVDRAASQRSPRRRAAIFVGTGVAAYLAALVWNIPASVALTRPSGIASLGGTLWRGRAVLIDGEILEWRWAPLRSLVRLGFAVDWTVAGPGTDLGGQALFGLDGPAIDQASGSATGSLLAVAMPSLAFVCGMPLQIAIGHLQFGGAAPALSGEIRSDSGLCAPKSGGAASLLPPLSLRLDRAGSGSAVRLAPIGQRRRALMQGTLDSTGRLHLTVTPDGARALPFLAPPGGMALETTL